MSNKIMVVVAHPDDEVLGCGGSIIKHIHAGDEVHIIVLADGVTSRTYRTGVSQKTELKECKKAISIRKKEFFQAADIMKIKKQNCYWLGLPDQRLDAIPLLDIIIEIEKVAVKTLPNIVYTHHWGDLNKDHRICYEATMTAFRPGKQCNEKKSIFCFEISGNMNFMMPKSLNRFLPNHFVDISPYIEMKLMALKTYESAQLIYPSPLSPGKIMELSAKRAMDRRYRFAEAFEKVK